MKFDNVKSYLQHRIDSRVTGPYLKETKFEHYLKDIHQKELQHKQLEQQKTLQKELDSHKPFSM